MSAFFNNGTNPLNSLPKAKASKARAQYEADFDAFYGNRSNYNIDYSKSRKLADDMMRRMNPEALRKRGYNPSYGQPNSFTDEFGNVVNRDQAPPRDQDQAPPPPPGSYVKPYQPNGGVTFVGQSGNPSSTSGTLDMSLYGTSIRPQFKNLRNRR